MSDNPMQDGHPITSAELDQLLLSLAYQDLSEGEDINDHPTELARQKIKKLEARIDVLEAPYRMTDTPPSEPGWYVVKVFANGPWSIAEVYEENSTLYVRDQSSVATAFIAEWGSAKLSIELLQKGDK